MISFSPQLVAKIEQGDTSALIAALAKQYRDSRQSSPPRRLLPSAWAFVAGAGCRPLRSFFSITQGSVEKTTKGAPPCA